MITLRLTTSEDLPRIFEIETACFQPPIRWAQADLAIALTEYDVWVAELVKPAYCDCTFWPCGCTSKDDIRKIVGFIICPPRQGQGYIGTIDVDPEERGQGVATMLIIEAEEEFRKRGFSEMFLEVNVNNLSQTLYFKLGYRVTSVQESYYGDGTAALFMTKKL
jgi:ribosomal protein S18 acetylase RimI-like enzyme